MIYFNLFFKQDIYIDAIRFAAFSAFSKPIDRKIRLLNSVIKHRLFPKYGPTMWLFKFNAVTATGF